MIPVSIEQRLSELLQSREKQKFAIKTAFPLSGGCINQSYRLETTHGQFFLKYNLSSRYPGMFETEAMGLELLRDAGEIRVPEPILTSGVSDYSFILQEFISQTAYADNFWQDFGRRLARLHRHNHSIFGLDHDNYIGSLHQSNLPHADWISFFIEERLDRQIKLGLDEGNIPKSLLKNIEILYQRLPEIIPVEPPSLLHGDLWSGNFITDAKGDPCLIDPAVYYGHREVDLAMTKLFGGFNVSFYEAYNDVYKLEPGWKERMEIHNLYPLLVHVNLFGGGYLSSVESIIRRF
ncbi:MAG: fructosamine kinase family protein [Bacteroidales bacterium]